MFVVIIYDMLTKIVYPQGMREDLGDEHYDTAPSPGSTCTSLWPTTRETPYVLLSFWICDAHSLPISGLYLMQK